MFPSSEVWEGAQLTLECEDKSKVGVIWVREAFSDEDEMEGKELIAHGEQVFVDDERIEMEVETNKDTSISRLKVR